MNDSLRVEWWRRGESICLPLYPQETRKLPDKTRIPSRWLVQFNAISHKGVYQSETQRGSPQELAAELSILRHNRDRVFQASSLPWIEERVVTLQEVLERRTEKSALLWQDPSCRLWRYMKWNPAPGRKNEVG
jgi:hypothetical protein